MSPDKQNMAIAQACGVVSKDHWGHLYKTEQGYARDCPDYVYDLNAMHEAENGLTAHQRIEHGKQLQEVTSQCVVGYVGDYHRDLVGLSRVASATAAQRAEAFLRTVGKWEEDK
jgi:hypothetical protein